MKPTMEKMTNPANMLVHELMQQTMMESLQRRGGVRESGPAGRGASGQWLARGKVEEGAWERSYRAGVLPPPRKGRNRKEWPEGIGLERRGVDGGEMTGAGPRGGRGRGGAGPWEEAAPCALAPVDVVVERVVAPKSDQRSQAQPVGEEDLGSRIQPHL